MKGPSRRMLVCGMDLTVMMMILVIKTVVDGVRGCLDASHSLPQLTLVKCGKP